MFEGIEAGQFDTVSRAMQKSCHVVRSNVAPIIEGPRNAVDDLKYVQTFQNVGKLHNAEISWGGRLARVTMISQLIQNHPILGSYLLMNRSFLVGNGAKS